MRAYIYLYICPHARIHTFSTEVVRHHSEIRKQKNACVHPLIYTYGTRIHQQVWWKQKSHFGPKWDFEFVTQKMPYYIRHSFLAGVGRNGNTWSIIVLDFHPNNSSDPPAGQSTDLKKTPDPSCASGFLEMFGRSCLSRY